MRTRRAVLAAAAALVALAGCQKTAYKSYDARPVTSEAAAAEAPASREVLYRVDRERSRRSEERDGRKGPHDAMISDRPRRIQARNFFRGQKVRPSSKEWRFAGPIYVPATQTGERTSIARRAARRERAWKVPFFGRAGELGGRPVRFSSSS